MRRSLRLSKPNTLPVLNCLFAALNNNGEDDDDEETPYLDVPATPNTHVYLSHKMGGSYTQDDLR